MKNNLPLILLYCNQRVKTAFIKASLTKSYSIIHTESVEESLKWLEVSPIKLVILHEKSLNLALSKVCALLQETSERSQLPIVLITESIQKTVILEALRAGVTDFIHEPLQASEIEERISVALYSKLINQKVKSVEKTLKNLPLFPKNSLILEEKSFILDTSLKAITSAKKGAIPLGTLQVHLDSPQRLKQRLKVHGYNALLKSLKELLEQRLRRYDTLIEQRPGQYLILLPKTSLRAAEIIASDIQKQVATTTFQVEETEVLITVSIGVIAFEKQLSKSAEDFEKFDHSLDKIKKSLLRSKRNETTIVKKLQKGIP